MAGGKDREKKKNKKIGEGERESNSNGGHREDGFAVSVGRRQIAGRGRFPGRVLVFKWVEMNLGEERAGFSHFLNLGLCY